MPNKIKLPTLRGRMGDWIYYVTLMPFKEISKRTAMAEEIHKSQKLSRWIQREVSDRSKEIVNYLNYQDQRFFNAIIFGIYGGKPSWQELDISEKESKLNETEIDYLNRTFGILTLNGDEKIFAIDGQHRTKAIKEVLKKSDLLSKEEVATIFVSHKKSKDGEIRTRRLFSTLNRYAKPVNISEIIALDEEDNCAIITRNLIEKFKLLNDKIIFTKTRSINPNNTDSFTNIILLYDIVKILLTDYKILDTIKVKGEDTKSFTTRRVQEELIKTKQNYIQKILQEVVKNIPSVQTFFNNGYIDRNSKNTNLIFRPIGQIIFFSVLKVAINNFKKKKLFEFFAKEEFNLNNEIWKKVFWDEELGKIKTDKSLQRYAISLIIQKLKIKFKQTQKDKEVFESFGFDPETL